MPDAGQAGGPGRGGTDKSRARGAGLAAGAMAGGFVDPPRDAARAFRAIMAAMAEPGRIVTLAGARPPPPLSPAAAAVLLVLADGAAPVHLAGDHDRAELRGWLQFHTGAATVAPAAAAFAVGGWSALMPVARFAQGTDIYPDRGATLMAEVAALAPATHRLRGPGIADAAPIALPPGAAEALRACPFPRGHDLILTCGDSLACLPRSSRIEVA